MTPEYIHHRDSKRRFSCFEDLIACVRCGYDVIDRDHRNNHNHDRYGNNSMCYHCNRIH